MKPRQPIRKVSKKKQSVKREYKKVCDEIDRKQLDTYDRIKCVSCNITLASYKGDGIESTRNWGHSHNLPKGRFPEFETDEDNIGPRCQDFGNYKGCHEALDKGDFERIAGFKDLRQIMEYRKVNYPSEYNKFVTELQKIGVFEFKHVDL